MIFKRALQMRGWLVLVVLGLTACGFHLRGNVVLPTAMERTYVEGDRFSLLVRELGTLLKASGATVVSSREEASAVLKVLGESGSRRVLSVGVTGKAAEYEVSHSVSFILLEAGGGTLVAQQSLAATRNHQFDVNDVLGKDREEDQLREEMQRDLALQIMRLMSRTAQ